MDKFDNLFILNLNPNKEIKKKYLLEVEKYIIPMAKKDLTSLHKKLEEIVDFQNQNPQIHLLNLKEIIIKTIGLDIIKADLENLDIITVEGVQVFSIMLKKIV